MNKKSLSEASIISKYIMPAVENAGWDRQKQIAQEVSFTDGRIIVRKKVVTRGKTKRADIILYYKNNLPLAIIEAKDNNHSIDAGMQQGLGYGETLDIPFVYSSNGDGFIEHDRTKTEGTIERELLLDKFPSPDELWDRYKSWKGITEDQEKVVTHNYYYDQDCFPPRYYQRIAINRTVEAIAQGQDKVLLVMATGTGKTYTAFQIVYRLFKSGVKKRILYLADRNILVDQTIIGDFKPLKENINKIKNRTADKSREIQFALYQSLTGETEEKKLFKKYSKDYFDLIIIDECHRGSAKDDSAWREILDHFDFATKVGLTATPKETKDVSNIDYFGEAIFTYSLKQGIEDGFLAPYKVVRVGIDRDLEGYRPEKGKTDKYGEVIEDRIYNKKDFDKTLVLEKRTEIVAKYVSDYLKKNNKRMAKTIFFCTDIDHANRMRRALANENSDLVAENSKYVMKITGDDDEGKDELENFITPSEKYPTLVTTSKLLTTGVDCKTCEFIVIDSEINSMIEFKQILGRGTRIREDYGKMYFTLIDFRDVSRLFADKDFDGDPVRIKEVDTDDIPDEEDEDSDESTDDITEDGNVDNPYDETGNNAGGNGFINDPFDEGQCRKKYYVNDVQVMVINDRVMYYGADGKLITESLKDYTKNNIRKEFATLDEFIRKWSETEKKEELRLHLEEEGIFLEDLIDEVGNDMDTFDLICHIAYDMPALTRKERANNVKKRNYFGKYGEKARIVLEKLLDKYANEGIENIEDIKVLKLPDFQEIGTQLEIVKKVFGGKKEYEKAVKELVKELYTIA
ncbi:MULTISPECIES: EcoAI/FtnUII family type I restriction enzme subunit R [unclassified Clostridium]|uniref:EcoAI/FtnUII family type I restriction enzme subunit R n=1 Tax=unclassified Clostridium TaxID=2614128 RepID=UPI00029865CD|nr:MULTISPECIES: DEAD/DEAH box helicase family protein [unclassified Clostridium]EKQ52682.1 MAG: helicase, type I site-specific restriction-modification system restriction subunit [Clostridium sp. Maddingley MBC34-26]